MNEITLNLFEELLSIDGIEFVLSIGEDNQSAEIHSKDGVAVITCKITEDGQQLYTYSIKNGTGKFIKLLNDNF